jgi:hypothetical protein
LRFVTTSGGCAVVLLELVVEVVVDVEVEPEGGSASPISAQGIAVEDRVKGKYVGEDTPLVAYSALPPNVPPLDPGDRVKPMPAAVETTLVSPTILTRKAPLWNDADVEYVEIEHGG